MAALHILTPLLEHYALSSALNKRVLLKMENTQPSGSFKIRGLGLLCQRAVAQSGTHLICPSGGNAGFATAVAGRALKVPTTILVPHTTPESVRDQIRAIGAQVLVHGQVWDETNHEAKRLCTMPGAVYVSPFDHPHIWEGHATLIDEAVAQARPLEVAFDVVICSVGGGGLLCGVLEGLHRNGLSHIPVIAVETEGTASFHASIKAGERVTLPKITSIATSLGAKRVASAAFEWRQRHKIISVTVTDRQAVNALLTFADDMRTLVEPACGAALALAYDALPILDPFKAPLIVVCGGIGVDLEKCASHYSLPV
jgi:L-serine/L-threonine ammonia-lyase